MSECSHNCGTCGENCSSRTQDKKSFLEALAPESSVKKVIGVVSGKGGVGKSLVTSMMAVSMSRKGKHAAILDADITGPSIPMDVDYMFVDMPPGTGDVPLTVFQSLPVDGIIIVTSPQELVGMIVAKAVNMAKKMNVPILGIVENMSYLECPDCGKHINVFGESHTEQVAEEYGLKLLAQIPIDPKIAQMVDGGQVEYIEMPWFEEAVKAVENL